MPPTGGYLALMYHWLFMRRKRMSFMPFLPRAMPSSRQVTLELRMVSKPHGSSWRDVHEFRKDSEMHPAKDDDTEIIVRNEDLRIRCRLADKPVLEQIVESKRLMERGEITVFFVLDFADRADDLLVTLSIQNADEEMEIEFMTRFDQTADSIEMPSMTVRIDSSGGEIEIEECGIRIDVPPGALKTPENITIKPLCNPPQIDMTPSEMLASWGFQCSPGGLKFHEPIQVRLSHCAVFSKHAKIQAVLYMSDNDKDGGVYRRFILGNDCRVEKDFLHFHIDHFSSIFVTLLSTAVEYAASFIFSKRVYAVPFLQATEPASKYHLKVFIYSNNLEELQALIESQNELEYRMMETKTELPLRLNGGDVHINLNTNPAGPVDHKIIKQSDILHVNCLPIYFSLNFENMARSVIVMVSVTQGSQTKRHIEFPIKREARGTTHHQANAQSRSGSTASCTDLVTDELLTKLCKHIPTKNYNELSNKLGIEYTRATGILMRFNDDYERATRECLDIWKNKTGGSLSELSGILQAAELGNLRRHLPQDGFDDVLQRHPAPRHRGNQGRVAPSYNAFSLTNLIIPILLAVIVYLVYNNSGK